MSIFSTAMFLEPRYRVMIRGTVTGDSVLDNIDLQVTMGLPSDSTAPPSVNTVSLSGTGASRTFSLNYGVLTGPYTITAVATNTANLQGTATVHFSSLPDAIRVLSPKQLLFTLYDPNFTGRVIVPSNADWDLSGLARIPLRSGVALIGERGPLGARPRLFTNYKAEGYPLFELIGNDVRVEGIHFQGLANGSRSSSQPYVTAIEVVEDPGRQTAAGSSSPTTSSTNGPAAA